MTAFDHAFDRLIGVEGETFVNHPQDVGGPTKFGITQATLSSFLRRQASILDVKRLTRDNAKAIYRKFYWDPLSLDGIPEIPAILIFDQGVNRGIVTVAHQVQDILGMSPSSRFSPPTLAAINQMDSRQFGLLFFKKAQESYLNIVISNPSQAVFLKGWINRTYGLLDLVLG